MCSCFERKMAKAVTAVVIGAGKRGQAYSSYALEEPEKLKVVGVAEPNDFRRNLLQKRFDIAEENTVTDWRELAQKGKISDCAIICTQDRLHKEPAIAFANLGYHILLEKPLAVTYQDCVQIVEACKKNDVIFATCHVLRYSPHAQKIKELIDQKAIGDVVNIQHLEPVGFWHFAHSYVRGNWRNSTTSSVSLLAKSCHDIDLDLYWMYGKQCARVSSFGSLKHFTPASKPAGAANRCVDCKVQSSCPYSAVEIYVGCLKMGHTGFPVNVIADVPDIESVTEAIKTGPYGRCVYDCDNDVMDNQVVNLQFETGETVSFSMIAFTEKLCERQVRVFGTKGELTCDFGKSGLQQFDFLTQQTIFHDLTEKYHSANSSRLRGHGGSDYFLVESFVDAVQSGDRSKILTGAEETLMSHLITFLADRARVENRVIEVSKEPLDTL